MKTSIKTLVALFITSVLLGVSALAMAAEKDAAAVQTSTTMAMSKISDIIVAGNVEVILVQGKNESVKVYDQYYPKNALVQQENGVLRITSFDKELLTVTVTVDQLKSIQASDKATVRTHGKFSLLRLSIVLNGSATADINAETITLATNISDLSKLTIAGNTEEFHGVLGARASMNLDNLVARSSNVRSALPTYAVAQTAAPLTLAEAAASLEME